MKKYILLFPLLFLPLSALAATPKLSTPKLSAQTLYGFMDNKYYNQGGELKVYGFMDGKYYDITGQEVYKTDNGEFLPAPVSGEIATSTPIVATPTPVTNILFPQPAIIPPTESPAPVVMIPVVPDICPNLTGTQPSLPQGMIIVNGQCMADTSITPYITNVMADSENNISFNINGPFHIMPKVEYSLNSDMSDSKMESQVRDEAGNTEDVCTNSQATLNLNKDNLQSGTTYYFRVKAYQCWVPNVSPWQLYLGQTDIYSLIIK